MRGRESNGFIAKSSEHDSGNGTETAFYLREGTGCRGVSGAAIRSARDVQRPFRLLLARNAASLVAFVSDAPSLPEEMESFPDRRIQLPFGFRLMSNPTARLQIQTDDRDRMVQVQDTRFIYNWIKKRDVYPRYYTIRKEFEGAFGDFGKFVERSQLAKLRVNQWEVTYVNHVHSGELWKTHSELPRLFPGLMKPIEPYGGTVFETFAGEWHSEIPQGRGRLYVNAQLMGIVQPDGPPLEAFVLRLTARGPANNDFTWDEGFELGHNAIVRTFDEVTSETAKHAWGKE